MKPSKLTRAQGLDLIKVGLAGIVTAPMYWLLSSSDRWFLERFHGAKEVGIYSIGYSVSILGMMINGGLMSVYLPEASREYEEDREKARASLGRLMSRLVAAMGVIWLVAASAGGDMIRLLANERFHGAARYVPFIAGGVFFYGLVQIGSSGLLLVKQLRWSAFWWFVGGLVSLALNWALVPRWGGLGAAMTQAASFGFIALTIFGTSQLMYSIHMSWARLLPVMAGITAAGAFMSGPWNSMPLMSLLLKFPAGVVIAAVSAWIMAPDWCGRGLDYVRKLRFK